MAADKCANSESIVPDMEAVPKLQTADEDIGMMLTYLTSGDLPADKKQAQRLVLESKLFSVVEGVLYREDPMLPGRHCIVVPPILRVALMEEAHQGRFAGHLSQKVYDRLRRYVWWRGVRSDVHDYCKSCLVCMSRKGGCRPFRPSIPVSGPFHCLAVDIPQLPLSARGN